MATKHKPKALPAQIFVARRNEGDGEDEYIAVFDSKEDAVDDDGPTTVGVYKLTESAVYVKRVVVK